MECNGRILVEAIKKAHRLSLTIMDNDGNDVVLRLNEDKKLYHDIALAVQSAIINKH